MFIEGYYYDFNTNKLWSLFKEEENYIRGRKNSE